MLHQIVKSSALAMVILITLCKVLMTGLLKKWICEIEVVTWFLMLVSDTTIVEKGLEDTLNITSSKFFICFLIFIRWGWKENWSGKISTIQFPGLNSLLKKQKEGKNLLHLSSISIKGDFNWILCLAVRWAMDALWYFCSCNLLELRILWIIWLDRREDCCNKNLPYSFLRWRWMGTRPVMVSTLRVGDVQKAPVVKIKEDKLDLFSFSFSFSIFFRFYFSIFYF